MNPKTLFLKRASTLLPRKLKTQILLVTSFTLIVSLAVSITNFVKFFQEDKLAYLFELTQSRSEGLQAQIRYAFESKANMQEKKSADMSEIQSLTRMPIEGETFFYRNTKEKLIGVQAVPNATAPMDGNVQYATASYEEAFQVIRVHQVGFEYGIYSHQGAPLGGTFTDDKSFHTSIKKLVTESRLSKGSTTVGPWILSFNDIPYTNLFVVTRASRENILAPIEAAVQKVALLALGLGALSMTGLVLLLKGVLRPIAFLQKAFVRVQAGEFQSTIPDVQNEFRPVYEGLRTLETALSRKQSSIRRLTLCLESMWELSGKLQTTEVLESHVGGFLQTCKGVFDIDKSESPLLVLHASGDDSHGDTPMSKLWGVGLNKSQSLATLLESPELASFTHQKSGLLQIPSGPFQGIWLHLPFFSENVLEGFTWIPYANETLDEEDSHLAEIIRETWVTLLRRFQLQKFNHWQSQVTTELEVAKRLQSSCLQMEPLQSEALTYSIEFEPAERVGGDWVGIHRHKETQTSCFFLGDVTGHGVDSAFLTSLVSGVFQTFLINRDEDFQKGELALLLVSLATQVNRSVCASKMRKNMTFFCCLLEEKTGKLHYVLGGHPKPLLMRQQEGRWLSPKMTFTSSSMLGTNSESVFKVAEIQLQPGDVLVAYTDGLLENPVVMNGSLSFTKFSKSAVGFADSVGPFQGLQESFSKDLHEHIRNQSDSYSKQDDVAVVSVQWFQQDQSATLPTTELAC